MKARVVLFPTPGAGHLVSMLQLAKRILQHAPSVSITIILIHPPSAATATNSHVNAAAASGLDIDFIEVPRSEPAEGEGLVHLLRFIETHKPYVRETLASLPGVAAFVADMFCITVVDAAAELGIPAFIFYASSAACLAATLYLPTLNRRYEGRALKEVKENIQVPGMSPVPPTVIPGPLQDKDDPAHPWFLRTAGLYSRLDGVLVNTFHELEQKALTALADGLCTPGGRTPPVHPVGPLLGLDCAPKDGWECIEWLDRQPESSVVFLCFGSLSAFSAEQVREVACGLELSGARFLWSLRVRSSHVGADLKGVLPAGFAERTSGRGLVSPAWVPQIAILAHPAVGGFVSHFGWNSTLESVWFGVPMVAWPQFAEQAVNAFALVNGLGLGLRMVGEEVDVGTLVRGEELGRAVRALMEGEEGARAREKMKAMKESARRAVEEGRGSSYANLAAVVQQWIETVPH
ncbi:UDP-glycosyltransferase [Nymphaea thermarum]|nr:UDP-glycosyltransferase [Nymphaea thermarum]